MAPATASAGQRVTVSWKVVNVGDAPAFLVAFFRAVTPQWVNLGGVTYPPGTSVDYERSFTMPERDVTVEFGIMRRTNGDWVQDDYQSKMIKLTEAPPEEKPPLQGLAPVILVAAVSSIVGVGLSAALFRRGK